MLARGPRRTPTLPVLMVAPVALFAFDALRVLVTLASRSTAILIASVVVASVAVAASIPLVEAARRPVVVALVAAIGLARLVMQVLAPEPSVFGQALPAALILGLFGGFVATAAIVHGGRAAGIGLLLGGAVDIAILSSLATLPLPWWRGAAPVVGVLGLGMVSLAAAMTELRLTMPGRAGSRVPAAGVAAVGLWVGLHVGVVSNLGWVGVLSSAPLWLVVGVASVGTAAALVWVTQAHRESQPLIAAVIPCVAAGLLPAADGVWAGVLVASFAAGAGVAMTGGLERDSAAALERVEWAAGVVAALAVLVVAGREWEGLSTPQPAYVVLAAAIALLGLMTLTSRHNPGASGFAPVATIGGVVATLVAVGAAVVSASPEPAEAPAGELLVATVNIERGFLGDDRFDPQSAAQTLIELSADVTAVQAVTRGRIRDGAVDLARYLERQTGARIEWVGGRNGVGAALDLRVQAGAVRDRSLPGIAHVVDATFGGEGSELRVIAVDVIEAPLPRRDVGGMLLDLWGGTPRTVLTGSLGAGPESDPVASLLNAGLFDVTLVVADLVPLTWPAELPTVQLDYVLISQDLRPAGARIVDSSSSNHLPVISRVLSPEV